MDTIFAQLRDMPGFLRENMHFLADFYIFEFLILAGLYFIGRGMFKMNWRMVKALSSLEEDIAQGGGELKEMFRERAAPQQTEENKILRQKIDAILEQTRQATDNGDGGGKELTQLLERQGLYLYDQFAEIAAAQGEQNLKLQELREKQPDGDAPASNELLARLAEIATAQGEQTQKLQELRELREKQPDGGEPASEELIARLSERLAAEMNAKIESMSDKINNQISAQQGAMIEINELLSAKTLPSSPSTSAIGAQPRLSDMLAACLPVEAYMLDADINGHEAAALLTMPGGEGAIALDNGLDLEEMRYLLDDTVGNEARTDARTRFERKLTAHIDKIAETLIAPPATADRALMFVSSESAFAEIQSQHQHLVGQAMAKGVSIVSPTTLLSVLNTARAQEIVDQARNFENQLQEIGDYIGRAMQSVKRAETDGVQLVGKMRADGPPSLTEDESQPR